MNKPLLLALFASLGAAAACYVGPTEPNGPSPTATSLPTETDDRRPRDDSDDRGRNGDDSAADFAPSPSDTADSGTGTGVTGFTAAEVQALFTQRCSDCHDEAPMNLESNFAASTVGVKSTQVRTMSLIEPGDRTKSYLFHKVAGTHTSVGGSGSRMPRGGTPLSAAELEKLGLYIDGL